MQPYRTRHRDGVPPPSRQLWQAPPFLSMTPVPPESFAPLSGAGAPNYVFSSVPPHGHFDAPIRPESSASNVSANTFLTQYVGPGVEDFNTSSSNTLESRNPRGYMPYPAFGGTNNTTWPPANGGFHPPPYGQGTTGPAPINRIPRHMHEPGPFHQVFSALSLGPGSLLTEGFGMEQSRPNGAHLLAQHIMSGMYDDGKSVEDSAAPYESMHTPSRRNSHMSTGSVSTSTPRGPNRDAFAGQSWLLHQPVRTVGPIASGSINEDVVASAASLSPVKTPPWFAEIRFGRVPSSDQAFHSMPFVPGFLGAKAPDGTAVLKISNIPYNAMRSEAVALLGRRASIICHPEGSPYLAVHILMDRMSGKTQDLFVEVRDWHEANQLFQQFQRRISNGRRPKIGDRFVHVQLSSQQELMYAMFPRARCVTFDEEGRPEVRNVREDYGGGMSSAGFIGFLHPDEIALLGKHAENPTRSAFVQRGPNRPYECLISTLNKYPWYDQEHVLVSERDLLYEAVQVHLKYLSMALRSGDADRTLTVALLQELTVVSMTCPGFVDQQKATFAGILRMYGFDAIATGASGTVPFGGIHKHAANWPFISLTKQPDVTEGFFEYYLDLFGKAAGNRALHSPSNMFNPMLNPTASDIFAKLKIKYPTEDAGGPALTLDRAAEVEKVYLRELLAETLPHSGVRH